MATFLQAMDRKNKMDLNLLQLCINTKLTEAQAIPLAKVKAIWNPKDPYAMLNIDRCVLFCMFVLFFLHAPYRTSHCPRWCTHGLDQPPTTHTRHQPSQPHSFNASVRYGISYWLWGDADVVDTITTRFGINKCVPFVFPFSLIARLLACRAVLAALHCVR